MRGARAGELLGLRARNRALLARQHLLARSTGSVYDTVRHLIGIQSQWPQSPYVGLWSRVDGFDPAELSDQLTTRALVRIVLMRSTLFLVAAPDCGPLRTFVQPALERGFGSSDHAKRLGPANHGAISRAARVHVEAQPRTFNELAALLEADFPQWHGPSMAQVARVHLPLVQVTPRGVWRASGAARHTTTDRWLGDQTTHPDPPEPDPAELVRRYLAAYGPASVADLQWWVGMTRLGPVFERLRPELRTFVDETGRELFDLPAAPRPDADTPAPVRFLSDFDSVLLGHSDRRHVIAPGDQPRIFTRNGIVRATVLVDGMVSATWTLADDTLTVNPWRPLSTKDKSAIRAEGRRLVRLLQPDAAVVITPSE